MSTLGRVSSAGSVRHLAWAFVIAVLAVLTVTVAVPRLAGATPYTVLTSSMEPGLPAGSLVVVKPVDPDELGVGYGRHLPARVRRGSGGHPPRGRDRERDSTASRPSSPRETPTRRWIPSPSGSVQVKGERLVCRCPYLGHVSKLRRVAVSGRSRCTSSARCCWPTPPSCSRAASAVAADHGVVEREVEEQTVEEHTVEPDRRTSSREPSDSFSTACRRRAADSRGRCCSCAGRRRDRAEPPTASSGTTRCAGRCSIPRVDGSPATRRRCRSTCATRARRLLS